ncbi:ribosomal RNA small subunit methyltransferase E [Nocardioides baekrokdamisoli]|uniref:Ribosomal RNA small subunit methyltransferase E n=1 Tax=Nocardioides baekrokdamisoli TaxID=1804624 RepID=A0A3G9IXS2_9ACTN|nr:16S rRNA (uracil(1498)-N(3))-methyltransferase [Nocardioides baekrokdamisoli]BBH16088.1 ribosomal RNA small subunit methyltransferase E [Nocardioides baekrokdamisoli]
MSLPVHLVPDLGGSAVGSVVTITGDEAHHAVAVRRLRVGEQLMVVDGRGTVVTGTISETGKRELSVVVDDLSLHQEPTPSVTVVQAIPKGDRGELAVEVLTEIGVATIVPWAAARSVAVWKGERAEKSHARWAATAREAAKQARRAWFPTVAPMATTGQVKTIIAGSDLAVVLHEAATTTFETLPTPTGRVVLIVGPEGGLTEDEVAAFEAAGARTVRMGTEVLRTSTAGVAAASALLSRTPRWF